jgi:hypothetical protein
MDDICPSETFAWRMDLLLPPHVNSADLERPSCTLPRTCRGSSPSGVNACPLLTTSSSAIMSSKESFHSVYGDCNDCPVIDCELLDLVTMAITSAIVTTPSCCPTIPSSHFTYSFSIVIHSDPISNTTRLLCLALLPSSNLPSIDSFTHSFFSLATGRFTRVEATT